MIFELYIYNKSFSYQDGINKNQLEDKIKQFSIDCDYIRRYKITDKIFIHKSIYDEIIYPGITVMDIVCNPKIKNVFDRDIVEYLRLLISKSENTDKDIDDIVNNLENHSETLIKGILCLNKINDINDKYLIYCKNNWFSFHRYFLKIYPKNSDYYIDECRKYFPSLYFHDVNKRSIKDIIRNFSKKITEALSALNDDFPKYKTDPYNRKNALQHFSIECGLEVTPEGDAINKRRFTFNFINNKNIGEPVCCEPHMKLSKSDDPGDTHHYQNRIYFHEGKKNIENGKTLVGHIGTHL